MAFQRKNDSSPSVYIMEDAGQKLKRIRERLNLRFREVEEASIKIAERHSTAGMRFPYSGSRGAD